MEQGEIRYLKWTWENKKAKYLIKRKLLKDHEELKKFKESSSRYFNIDWRSKQK